MKKLYLFTITLLSVVYLSAQVKDFSIVSSKTYENNTRTSYLLLDANLDDDTAILIEKELEQHPDISRFSFYAKPNLSKCMFTTNISIDEQVVVDLMNDVIYTNGNNTEIPERQFKNLAHINDFYKANFTLDIEDDYDLMNEIYRIFKESDIISDVNYKGNSSFEIYTLEEISPDEVEKLLLNWDIKIKKEFIKQ